MLVAGSFGCHRARCLYLCVRVDLGPRDKNVDGERHVTLTGWDRGDYSVLRLMPDVSVLQMANADVTDDVLEGLRGMKNLHELDLNGTQVTDAGLGSHPRSSCSRNIKTCQDKDHGQRFS